MRHLAFAIATVAVVFAACATRERPQTDVTGEYESQDGKSGLILYEGGTYFMVRKGELDLEIFPPRATWRQAGNRITLSWAEDKDSIGSISYRIVAGDGQVVLQLAKGEQLPASFLGAGIQIDRVYRRILPNQPADRMPGSSAPGEGGRP